MSGADGLALLGGRPVRTEPPPRWPVYGARERKALADVLASRKWGGDPMLNRHARAFTERFAVAHGARFAVPAANGTVALKVALRAAGIQAGDEVVVPPLTWIATATAALDVNAVPVFADVEADTYCLDPDAVEAALTERTRAIIPVHLGCRIADMDRLTALAKRHGLAVIEDCAHAHGARWRGRGAGTLGDLGSFSFQSSKLMTAGEGGVILTDDETLRARCVALTNCGRKEPGYDAFSGRLAGWNDRITEWQAAVLGAQLDRLESQTVRREDNADYLDRQLAEFDGIAPLRRDPRITRTANYQVILRYCPDAFAGVHRDRFAAALAAEGIPCTGHLYNLVQRDPSFYATTVDHPQLRDRYGDGIGPDAAACPVAARAVDHEAVWLAHPLFLGNRRDMDQIVEAIEKIHRWASALLR